LKTVFEPSNALEGYMLEDLLKQRGIAAHVEGAQLQGGVGELPVSGFVRIVVEDADHAAARAVIEEWESANVSTPIPVPTDRTTKMFVAGLVGLAIGIAGTYAFLTAPTNLETADNNQDGKFDEYLSYSPLGVLLKSEIDRNFDGKIDLVSRFDRMFRVESVDADDDFNGSFETHWYYSANQVYLGEVDTDGDSSIDLKSHFKSGVPVSTEYFVRGAAQPDRIEYFALGKIKSAEVDTDRDGRLDKRYRYSDLAEVIGTESIEASD
jgi:hypothetical protein